MYEQISHSMLAKLLPQLRVMVSNWNLDSFQSRIGANFYAIHSLFHHLYGQRSDFETSMLRLVEVMTKRYILRDDELKAVDLAREEDHNWFLSQEWIGMSVYLDGFTGDLNGLQNRLPYLRELGINLVHLAPVPKCPTSGNNRAFSVTDFKRVDPRLGTIDELRDIASSMRDHKMLLSIDLTLNHTADEHIWAKKARAGDRFFQDYYYMFPDRDVPDMFEETMPEMLPETSSGNFTWDETLGQWVMTVFETHEWDLNYSNPYVFIEMLDIILFWANAGVSIVHLNFVAYLWKKIGSTCQNEREAHLILQLMKDCFQVVAPGVLFAAGSIDESFEMAKYFGEDAVIAKECEIADNSALMSLLWDAIATKNIKLLSQGLNSLPMKIDRATWFNYIRCHDAIGLAYENADIERAGYEPISHRRFLVDYFTGIYDDSDARGQVFGRNTKTGDARIAGSLASLIGLEAALEAIDDEGVDRTVSRILLLHGVILSFGGIPLIYYGDEIGTMNDWSFLQDENKAGDNRWMHRPRIAWERAERRHQRGTVEQRIYDGLKRLISVRKSIPAFADFNNRELLSVDNEHLFVFLRSHPERMKKDVMVVVNFDVRTQYLDLVNLGNWGRFQYGQPQDLASGETPALFKNQLVVPPCRFYWLTDDANLKSYSPSG